MSAAETRLKETPMHRPTLVALACLSAPVLAQEIDCSQAMAQSALNQCAYQDWQAADSVLNTVYREVVAAYGEIDARLPPELGSAVTALREGQRAWVDFRDKACAAEGFVMRGGSAEPLVVYGCMRLLTEERTGHLQGMLAAMGG
jgi:uncharacterized protein YecT (DUF1311 family)